MSAAPPPLRIVEASGRGLAALMLAVVALGALFVFVGVEDGEQHVVIGGSVVAVIGVLLALFFALRPAGRVLLSADADGFDVEPYGFVRWSVVEGFDVVYHRGVGHVVLRLKPSVDLTASRLTRAGQAVDQLMLGGRYAISTAAMKTSAEDLAQGLADRRAFHTRAAR
ncbi:MAG: hypothetical protein AAF360_17150 [Pseudomonadota bacterium]